MSVAGLTLAAQMTSLLLTGCVSTVSSLLEASMSRLRIYTDLLPCKTVTAWKTGLVDNMANQESGNSSNIWRKNQNPLCCTGPSGIFPPKCV